MSKRPTTAGIALLAFLCLGCVTDTLAQTETTERTARLRQSLEAQFRASTGLGFARFQCAFPPGEKPAGEKKKTEEIPETIVMSLDDLEGKKHDK